MTTKKTTAKKPAKQPAKTLPVAAPLKAASVKITRKSPNLSGEAINNNPPGIKKAPANKPAKQKEVWYGGLGELAPAATIPAVPVRDISSAIESDYVLCAIESRIWSGIMTDNGATDEFTKSKKADSKAGRFLKTLVTGKSLNAVRNAVNKARSTLYGQSVPWIASSHLVKLDRMSSINETINSNVEEFNEAVEAFLSEYPSMQESAKARLGGLYNESDFPAADTLRKKFSLRVVWLPVSATSPSQMKILDATMAGEVAQASARAAAAAMGDARETMMERVASTVEDFNGSLGKFNKALKDDKRAIMRQARLDTLKDAASNLQDYAFPATPDEAKVVSEVATILKDVAAISIDAIRDKEDGQARTQAKSKLDAIKAKLAMMKAMHA